ncbi:response regulator transcription factor [Paenibacillus riograndensis]|uniref:Regulatory protein VanR n=1 Tax=Paenibacillus riograndensis SBR5 TaxID=1073571 RepID=A0A0E4HAD2_9BACL|nr:response regulator transcription factor [Paenibacillus riograndensis]CQR55729.1 Regulatory protein VanR [Paenibacillus riograndensis SBR5]
MKKVNILVVDDDSEIRDVLHIYLRNEGYVVMEAGDGLQALNILQHNQIHLILLDIMMPSLDGIAACLQIRAKYDIPIIMLSAKEEVLDKITGLSVGADDYVTKPFNPLELMARVKAQIRRQKLLASLEDNTEEIRIGELVINKSRHSVEVGGSKVSLTPIEFSILELLASHCGQVFSVDMIYRSVWKDHTAYFSENTVMVHIRNIREKIEISPREPRYIKTIWGVGYKIEK